MNSLLELPAFSLLHALQNNDCDFFFNVCAVNVSCASNVEAVLVTFLYAVHGCLNLCPFPSGRYLERSASLNQLCFPAWFACSFGYSKREF